MTKSRVGEGGGAGGGVRQSCAWCGRPFDAAAGPGRPRRFCRRSCRQREYESRRRSAELGLGEDELVVTRHQLRELGDLLYVLGCAVEDVERDLAGIEAPTAADLRSALDWVLDAARPCVARPVD